MADALFLTENAVAASTTLSPMIHGTTIPMTDLAARRFGERRLELGVVQVADGSMFRTRTQFANTFLGDWKVVRPRKS